MSTDSRAEQRASSLSSGEPATGGCGTELIEAHQALGAADRRPVRVPGRTDRRSPPGRVRRPAEGRGALSIPTATSNSPPSPPRRSKGAESRPLCRPDVDLLPAPAPPGAPPPARGRDRRALAVDSAGLPVSRGRGPPGPTEDEVLDADGCRRRVSSRVTRHAGTGTDSAGRSRSASAPRIPASSSPSTGWSSSSSSRSSRRGAGESSGCASSRASDKPRSRAAVGSARNARVEAAPATNPRPTPRRLQSGPAPDGLTRRQRPSGRGPTAGVSSRRRRARARPHRSPRPAARRFAGATRRHGEGRRPAAATFSRCPSA